MKMITFGALVAVAFIMAAGMAVVSMKIIERRDRTYVGPWYVILPNGCDEGGMYTRTWYTLTALFGLKKDEQIYFVAETDDSGKPLSADHDYRISGSEMVCRWWNITVYGEDRYLMKSPENRYTCSSFDVRKDGTGDYTIHLSPEKKNGDWLYTGTKGNGFSIMLRINHPSQAMIDHPGGIKLPAIIREDRT